MKREHADAILATLHTGGWHHRGPYCGGKCLGMAIADTLRDPAAIRQAIGDLCQQILRRYPHRASPARTAPAFLMFDCCNNTIIPAFNDHPDTTFDDIREILDNSVTSNARSF